MDSELVSDSESDTGRDDGGSRSALPITYTERFEELFPFYLAIGMTAEQYWDGDSQLVRAYRKAYDLKREIVNQDTWLQGLYIYEALCCVSPIFRALSKAKKPLPYRAEPYPLKTALSEMKEERREREKYNLIKEKMEAFAARFNEKYKEGSGNNG